MVRPRRLQSPPSAQGRAARSPRRLPGPARAQADGRGVATSGLRSRLGAFLPVGFRVWVGPADPRLLDFLYGGRGCYLSTQRAEKTLFTE